MLALARSIALSHHEKWDGSGYPNGLAGEQIPLVGRICAVADVFDALTSVRPYKKAWTEEEAIALLVREKGKHFDPTLVDLFIAQMPAIRAIRQRWAEELPEPEKAAA
jgi:putative two-component system response regulator